MYSTIKKRKVSQEAEEGSTLKAMAALGIIIASILLALKYAAPLPKGW